MLNVAVLVSGGGTNLQAILDAKAAGALPHAKIALVLASKPGVYALERASKAGVPGIVVARKSYAAPEEYDAALLAALREHRIDVVVTKDSGGEMTAAKLVAARDLGVPVIVVRRPPPPEAPRVATVEAAIAWLGEQPAVSSVIPGARSVDQARSNAAAGPAARPALPRSPARRRVAEPLSPDGTGPAQRAPRAPPRAWARWPGRCCCRCWLSGSCERPRRWPPRPSRCLSGWPRPPAGGLCLPRGPDPPLSPARTAWRSPWNPLGVRPTSWPWWITCRGTPAAATTWRCRSGPPRRR